jgi:hypothetical protein
MYSGDTYCTYCRGVAVHTENSVRSENTGVPIIREIMVATTMISLLVTFFTLLVSTFRTRAALQADAGSVSLGPGTPISAAIEMPSTEQISLP